MSIIDSDPFIAAAVDGILSGRLHWQLRVMDGLHIFKSDDSAEYYAIIDLWDTDDDCVDVWYEDDAARLV